MKITTQVAATDKDGKPVNLQGANDAGKYAIITPDYYLATVKKIESKSVTNPNTGITYLKIVPHFEIHNDAGTTINRQEFVVGTIDENGALYRPENDGKPALWGGKQGAQYLLFALGLLKSTGVEGQYAIDADPDDVVDQVVRVRVETGEYESNGETKQKNVIANVFALNADQAEKGGFIFENGAVFLNALAKMAATARASKSGEPTF